MLMFYMIFFLPRAADPDRQRAAVVVATAFLPLQMAERPPTPTTKTTQPAQQRLPEGIIPQAGIFPQIIPRVGIFRRVGISPQIIPQAVGISRDRRADTIGWPPGLLPSPVIVFDLLPLQCLPRLML